MGYKNIEDQRKYQREWLAKRRQAWLDENGPCVDCGSNQNLEVDHREPEEKITHNVWSWSKERMAEELSKCEVRCYDCHLKKTKDWWNSKRRHGTLTMYYGDKCRCDECRAAKAVHNSKRRYDPVSKKTTWTG